MQTQPKHLAVATPTPTPCGRITLLQNTSRLPRGPFTRAHPARRRRLLRLRCWRLRWRAARRYAAVLRRQPPVPRRTHVPRAARRAAAAPPGPRGGGGWGRGRGRAPQTAVGRTRSAGTCHVGSRASCGQGCRGIGPQWHRVRGKRARRKQVPIGCAHALIVNRRRCSGRCLSPRGRGPSPD